MFPCSWPISIVVVEGKPTGLSASFAVVAEIGGALRADSKVDAGVKPVSEKEGAMLTKMPSFPLGEESAAVVPVLHQVSSGQSM